MEQEAQLSTPKQRFAWCLYDFANSAFPTVIVTAVYVLYFKNVVLTGYEAGYTDYLWGTSNSVAALIVFLTAPFLGAIADARSQKRLFLIGFSLLCVVATALLSLTGEGTVLLAVVIVVVAVFAFESAMVFYNAFLPELAPENKMGRLSGNAWALGYIGGLGSLGVTLAVYKAHLQSVPLVVAGWFVVFAVPAFLYLKDQEGQSGTQGPRAGFIKTGLAQVFNTLRHVKNYPRLSRFLRAYFFFNNAVQTIIVFAVAVSSDSFGFSTQESILLIFLMNIIAAPGAFVFGKLADRHGARQTLVATLIIWLVVVAGAEIAVWPGLFAIEEAKIIFWAVAALASLAIGAVQATSRSFVGQLAPKGRSGEFYGFMAFTGKSSAILGPFVFGLASDLTGSQRAAVLSIGVFFVIGLVFLLIVPAKDS